MLDGPVHKELVQITIFFVIDCWKEMTVLLLSLGPVQLTKLLSDLQPTPKKGLSATEVQNW